jgi:hypothetical protein
MPWAVKWVSDNELDGHREHLLGAANIVKPEEVGGYNIMVFGSRRHARAYIEENYGYVRTRPDLRREPHGWKMPRAVKVAVVVMEV